MKKHLPKIIITSIGLIIIVVLLVVCVFPNTFSKFSNTTVLSGTIKLEYSISNYLKNTNNLEKDNTKDSNYRYKTNDNNYLKIDNNLYQIIGIFNNNIKVIDTNSIGKYSYNELDNILNNYYNNLSSYTKKIIVETNYYNGNSNSTSFIKAYEEEQTSSIKKNIYILNMSDYLFSNWLDSYVIDKDLNTKYSIYPVFTIDGSINYKEGNGLKNSPYVV